MASPVTRDKKTVELFIDSRNRDPSSNSSTDFRINVVNPAKSKILLCGLKSVTFPNGIYNISGGSVQIIDSIGLKNITIPGGNYTAAGLAIELQTLLNALGVDAYTVTSSGKFNITSSYSSFVLNPNSLVSGILSQMGFLAQSYTGSSVVATNLFDLSGIKNVFIKINQITGYIRNSLDIKYNYKFDLTCEYGKVIFFSNQSKYIQDYDVTSDNLVSNSYFDIQLVDQYGNVVNNNGLEWNFTLGLVTQSLNQP